MSVKWNGSWVSDKVSGVPSAWNASDTRLDRGLYCPWLKNEQMLSTIQLV